MSVQPFKPYVNTLWDCHEMLPLFKRNFSVMCQFWLPVVKPIQLQIIPQGVARSSSILGGFAFCLHLSSRESTCVWGQTLLPQGVRAEHTCHYADLLLGAFFVSKIEFFWMHLEVNYKPFSEYFPVWVNLGDDQGSEFSICYGKA